jgi:hypothetical protein
MSTKDYFGTEIAVGDTVSFPTSGEMEDGEVVRFTPGKNTILIRNSNGNVKLKYPENVINKSRIMPILKDTHPEDYI